MTQKSSAFWDGLLPPDLGQNPEDGGRKFFRNDGNYLRHIPKDSNFQPQRSSVLWSWQSDWHEALTYARSRTVATLPDSIWLLVSLTEAWLNLISGSFSKRVQALLLWADYTVLWAIHNHMYLSYISSLCTHIWAYIEADDSQQYIFPCNDHSFRDLSAPLNHSILIELLSLRNCRARIIDCYDYISDDKNKRVRHELWILLLPSYWG